MNNCTNIKDIDKKELKLCDVVKHYVNGSGDDTYDVGVITYNPDDKKFHRTSTDPNEDPLLSEGKYQYLGNIEHDSLASIAARTWYHLSPRQKIDYITSTGIDGFLQDFSLRLPGIPIWRLTDNEKRDAKRTILKHSRID